MPEYMTSSEALLALPEKQPAHHIRGGLKSLGTGAAITIVGDGGAARLFYVRYPGNDWGDIAMYVGATVLGAVATYFGGRKILDGVTSFFDPLLEHRRDGAVYSRNEGYIGDHSRFDRRFGRAVRPIDEPAELTEIRQRVLSPETGEFFMNGAVLKSILFQKQKTETRREGEREVTTTKWVKASQEEIAGVPLAIGYMALFTVDYNGTGFRARTGNGRLVKFLAGVKQDSALRLLGRYKAGEIDRFDATYADTALMRDAA